MVASDAVDVTVRADEPIVGKRDRSQLLSNYVWFIRFLDVWRGSTYNVLKIEKNLIPILKSMIATVSVCGGGLSLLGSD